MKLNGEVRNVEKALARLEGDTELYQELLSLYLRELPKLRDRLRDALLAGEITEIATAAHTLKGASDNLGAERMVMFCRWVESLCREAIDKINSEELIEKLLQLSLELEQSSA